MTRTSTPSNGNELRPIRISRLGSASDAAPPLVDLGAAESFQPREELVELGAELVRHPELDLATLRYHIQQSDATATDGYWHASINEARSFLEALVMSMAVARQRPDLGPFRRGKESQSSFRVGCGYLQALGFIDEQEQALLQYVYSITSAKGAHHGQTDAPWSRLARRMVWSTAHYLLRRYEVWKRTPAAAPQPTVTSSPTPPPKPPPPPVTGWRRWLTWLTRGRK